MSPEKAAGPCVCLTLPGWLDNLTAGGNIIFPDPEERLRWVIELSRLNVENESGGPFASGIFASRTGRLVAAGVNRVEPLNLAPAHAEIMTILFAQDRRRSWDLGSDPADPLELVSSSQPCLMCLGAVMWSGVSRLIYGATSADVGAIAGFDEGPLPVAWAEEMRIRGIEVRGGLLRAEAVAILELYKAKKGTVYNSRRIR